MAVKSSVNERIATFSLPAKNVKRKKRRPKKDELNFLRIKALNKELR